MPYLFFLLILASANAYSEFDIYHCVIKQSQFVSNQGVLADQPQHKNLVGKGFSVDKHTGAIIGALTTDNPHAQPTIVDYGSKSQTFKVLIAYYPGTTVDLLLIEEYSSHSQKPFTFITLGSIFTGLCMTRE